MVIKVIKGPVKLANQAGENSSFIFTVCVKSVPHYHFKVAYVMHQSTPSANIPPGNPPGFVPSGLPGGRTYYQSTKLSVDAA